MSDIRTKPVTPEYEETWDRVFGKEEFYQGHYDPINIQPMNIFCYPKDYETALKIINS